jgi:hypothetical protein
MSLCRKAAGCMLTVVGALVAVTTLAPPATASPDIPCGSIPIPVCAFIPVLPDLDHDVDLTTDHDPASPSTPDATRGTDPPAEQ